MAEPFALRIPRETVNDDVVILVKWLVADGARVEADSAVAEIETSKANVQLLAEAGGFLRRRVAEGDEVPVGGTIAIITATEHEPIAASAATGSAATGSAAAASAVAASAAADSAPSAASAAVMMASAAAARSGDGNGELTLRAGDGPAFSKRARALLSEIGLDEAAFAGHGMVREVDVRAYDERRRPASEEQRRPASDGRPAGAELEPAPQRRGRASAARVERLSPIKRTEGRILAEAQRGALVSAVTVAADARPLDRAIAAEAARERRLSYLEFAIDAAARALPEFPELNAYLLDGNVHYYDEINIGVAFNLDKGLRVPVLRRVDARDPLAIARDVAELAMRYLRDELAEADLIGGTFTVTDLTGAGVMHVLPLINRDQTAILALGHDAASARLTLTLAFDHRVTDGQRAAGFLTLVKERLEAWGPVEGEATCSSCFLSLRRIAEDGAPPFLVPVIGADGGRALLCAGCLAGWNG